MSIVWSSYCEVFLSYYWFLTLSTYIQGLYRISVLISRGCSLGTSVCLYPKKKKLWPMNVLDLVV
jgi:hypothetical protein